MTPQEIITDIINGMNRDAVATMTSIDLLKKKINYVRKQAGIQRGERPTTKNGWSVPQDLETFVEDGGRFLKVRHYIFTPFIPFSIIVLHFTLILIHFPAI